MSVVKRQQQKSQCESNVEWNKRPTARNGNRNEIVTKMWIQMKEGWSGMDKKNMFFFCLIVRLVLWENQNGVGGVKNKTNSCIMSFLQYSFSICYTGEGRLFVLVARIS